MTRKISESVLEGRSMPIFDLFPAIFLLVLHNHFFHKLTVDIGLLLVLSFFRLHLGMSLKNRLPRIVVYLLSGACIYYSAGGFLLLFASLCGLHEIVIRRRPADALLYAGIAAILPYLGAAALFRIELKKAYWLLLPFDAGYKPVILPCLLLFLLSRDDVRTGDGSASRWIIRKIRRGLGSFCRPDCCLYPAS